nr:MAG TPA: hypothetical protein [Caudoviricetes sp.]
MATFADRIKILQAVRGINKKYIAAAASIAVGRSANYVAVKVLAVAASVRLGFVFFDGYMIASFERCFNNKNIKIL